MGDTVAMVDTTVLTWALGVMGTFGAIAAGFINRKIELIDTRIVAVEKEMNRITTLEAHRMDSDRRTSALEANVTQISAQFASMQSSIARQEVMLQLLINSINKTTPQKE